MSTVSIVMATYNGERYAGEQIESILSSSYQDTELFIYDDGSKDNSMSVLKKYEHLYPDKIHVFQNKINLGVTINFLQSSCQTITDYVMFCDQDDVWKPGKIEATLKRMKSMEAQFGNNIPIAVFTDAEIVDSHLRLLNSSFFKSGHLNMKKTDLAHLLMENKLIGCTVMFNAALRKVLKEHSMPVNARFHDWWIALIAASFGKISYLNQRTLLYRQHEENVVGNTTFLSYIKNRVSSLGKQRAAIRLSQKQAEEFNSIYENELTQENKAIIERFANLSNAGYIMRRVLILRYGYMKSGVIKNIGLMFIA
jgi:glycosyltransferase involved in cell wall biosynthesis